MGKFPGGSMFFQRRVGGFTYEKGAQTSYACLYSIVDAIGHRRIDFSWQKSMCKASKNICTGLSRIIRLTRIDLSRNHDERFLFAYLN